MKCCSRGIKMNSKTKRHICIEFCVRLEKTPKKMITLLKNTFGDKCLSYLSIKKWHKELKMVESQFTIRISIRIQTFFNHLPYQSANFIKLLRINGQNACRNAFWIEVAILRKIEAKMKMLGTILNRIFYSFFYFENCDRGR